MGNGKFAQVESVAALAIGAVTTASILNAGLSSAVQYRFTEPQFSFYNVSGEFRVDGSIGTVLSGALRSNQNALIDLAGLQFDGSYLLGTTQSGTQFSTLPPSGGPFGGRPPQQITLAPQDTVPGGFTGFSTPGTSLSGLGKIRFPPLNRLLFWHWAWSPEHWPGCGLYLVRLLRQDGVRWSKSGPQGPSHFRCYLLL